MRLIFSLLILAWVLTTGFMTVKVIYERRSPARQLAWIFSFLIFPFVGPFFYLLIGGPHLVKKTKKRLSKSDIHHQPGKPDFCSPPYSSIPQDYQVIFELANNLVDTSPTSDNKVEWLFEARQAYDSMLAAIETAETSIWLETFIFAFDPIGKQFMEALESKAREGVEVKVLVDRFGSFSLSRKFINKARGNNVDFLFFKTVRLVQGLVKPGFRNHRKILVIDQKFAYTGSLNITSDHLSWNDIHMRIEGTSVGNLAGIFAEDWRYAGGCALDLNDETSAPKNIGSSIIQVVDSWPDVRDLPLERTLLVALQQAKKSVVLLTPYFIPDDALKWAISTAGDRGIDVKVLLPSSSDSKLVDNAAKTFMAELLQFNIRFFLLPTMHHGKAIVIDDYFFSVGSCNFDMRSFHYNFETNIIGYDRNLASLLHKELQQFEEMAKKVDVDYFKGEPSMEHFKNNLCRLISAFL